MKTVFRSYLLTAVLVTSQGALADQPQPQSTAPGGENSGGNVIPRPPEPIQYTTKDEINAVIDKVPNLMQLYMNLFETLEWATQGGEFPKDLSQLVNSFVDRKDYRKYLNPERFKPQDEPCLYTDSKGQVRKLISSTKNGVICFSRSLALEEQWLFRATTKKVMGIYAHELAHIMGAPEGDDENSPGEILAWKFANLTETLVQEQHWSDILGKLPDVKSFEEFVLPDVNATIVDIDAADKSDLCTRAADLYNYISDVSEEYLHRPSAGIFTTDAKGMVKLNISSVRLFIAKKVCRNDKEIGVGTYFQMEELLDNGQYAKNISRRLINRLNELRKNKPGLFENIVVPAATATDETKIAYLKDQIKKAHGEFMLFQLEMRKVEKLH